MEELNVLRVVHHIVEIRQSQISKSPPDLKMSARSIGLID